MLFLIRALSFMPLPLLYVVADMIYFIIYRLFGYRKEVVRNNLKKAFPDKENEERKIIERKFYRNFADFIVETVKSFSIKPHDVMARVKFKNIEEINSLFRQHGSVLMMAGHQFNWEWMQLSASLQFPIPIDYIYQPLHSKSADQLMLFLRSRFGAGPIKRREAARQIIKRREQGKGFALVADQFPGSRDKKQWLDFFGEKTAFYQSIDQLARLFNIPVAYFNIEKMGRGQYEVTMTVLSISPKDDEEGAVIKRYAEVLEENIKRQPECWLWSHKRWKKKPD